MENLRRIYVNAKYNRETETVDEFDNMKEAREMLREYRMSSPGTKFWLSQRATKEWMEK